MYRVKISDRESLHSYNIFSYFCFGSSIPDSFLVAIKLWHVDVFIWSLQLVTLRFFFKYKCIRSTPHIWSQIRIFRVTIIYVNYLSFFGFFHLLLVWMRNILMIVIVWRCHTGLTFYFLRFCLYLGLRRKILYLRSENE